MTIISPDEYDLLMSLSGQEQNLQAANIGKKYRLTEKQILAMLPDYAAPANTNNTSNNRNFATANRPRFEYDPSPDASQRRREISQAITCPSCAAELGIPSIRPIRVTCPQCSQEHTFYE
ncbi:MAG: hypothetical protein CMB29_03830 [Euryarchaeota archaeon]|nr:hypothetical protein [Euryarchaeota archaeon]DAC29888.1 MAG TPA: hypothetical protein D7H81_03965 [Candidatus Poseidoniales archaeon]HII45186.1 hypothetical protein [Candidatus Poseidoniaceae archaeon]